MRRRFTRNADRFIDRLWSYPQMLRREYGDSAGLFHIVDHSYSQMIHALPAGRCGVCCHDLDTFRCILQPAIEPRPWWFRQMVSHILAGFQQATVVFYSTNVVRTAIEQYRLIEPARLVQAPMGVCEEFTPAAHPPTNDAAAFILHVGSCVPRKRIDV